MRIAVVGLGVIGESVAGALKKTDSSFFIIGIDKDEEKVQRAIDKGFIDEGHLGVAKRLDCEIVFACVSEENVDKTLSQLTYFADEKTVVCDTAFVKSEKAEFDFSYVGICPLFLKEQASEELFMGERVSVTPFDEKSKTAAAVVKTVLELMGARVLVLSTDEHNKIVADEFLLPKICEAGFSIDRQISEKTAKMLEQACRKNKEQVLFSIGEFSKKIRDFKLALDKESDELFRYFNTESE